MAKPLRDYDSLQIDGLNPLQSYLALRREGKGRVTCVRELRAKFALSLAEAKEVMVIAEGQGESLMDYQEDVILPALQALDDIAKEE